MSKKARWNYIVDMGIALMGLLSAVSGLVLLLAGPGGGYRGGRNPEFQALILGLSRHTWSDLHTWVSVLAILGIVVHLALHWNWIVCTTKLWLRPISPRRPATAEVCPTNDAA